MQNYRIEHRAPKKGELYLTDMSGHLTTAVACKDQRIPRPVLVPVAPAWPDPPVIVIEEGEQAGLRVATLPVVAIRMAGTPFAGAYRDEAGSLWHPGEDTITAWHEYVPDGHKASTERREYSAAELDSLPEGTCAWDENGSVWQRSVASWFVAGGDDAIRNPLHEDVRQHFYSAPPEDHQ